MCRPRKITLVKGHTRTPLMVGLLALARIFTLSCKGHCEVSASVRGVYDVIKASLRSCLFLYFLLPDHVLDREC